LGAESRIETLFGSAKLLLNIKSPTLLTTMGAVGTAFLGLGPLPVAVVAAGAVVNGGI